MLVTAPSGRYVLKIANAAFGEAELDLQNRAMVHVAERLPLAVPTPCRALDGAEIVPVERDGLTYLLRLVTFIEGTPLIDADHLAPAVLRALGETAGLVARALEGFEHPAADRALQWDPWHVGAVVAGIAPQIEDPQRRSSSSCARAINGRGRTRAARAVAATPGHALRRDRLNVDRPARCGPAV